MTVVVTIVLRGRAAVHCLPTVRRQVSSESIIRNDGTAMLKFAIPSASVLIVFINL